jgi:integrase/recombinase XerD
VKEDIKSFLNYLAVEKGLSENTSAAYQNDLYQLADFAQGQAAGRSVMPSWANFGRQGLTSAARTC